MKIATEISWSLVDDELYVINTKTNKCLILDATGNEIWDKIIQVKDTQAIITYFQEKYSESDRDKIKNDILELINLLTAMGVLQDENETN